ELQYDFAPGSSPCSAWPCATGKRRRTIHVYDVYDATGAKTFVVGYGNETATLSLGDMDATGDDKTTITTFYPNASSYLVSYPAGVQVFDGASHALVSEEDHCYDLALASACDATSWTRPPVRGDRTHTLTWVDLPSSSYIVSKAAFDGFGNLT